MNYKCFQSQPNHLRFNCANNIEIIKKNNKLRSIKIKINPPSTSKKGERNNLYQFYKSQQNIIDYSPLRIDYQYTENHQNLKITSPKQSKRSNNNMPINARSLHKNQPNNLNLGSPKIFRKLQPEQMIPSQLSIPVQTPKSNPYYQPVRVLRSDTQYSINSRKSSNRSLSIVNNNNNNNNNNNIKSNRNKIKKEPSALQGWYVEPEEYF